MNPALLMCRHCGERQNQGHGLCRRCARAAGVYTLSTREAEADRIARHAPPAVDPPPTRPVVIRIIDDVEYEVVWP